ncbi:MAG: polysaccharide biosynthesis tyrosine autokinase [Candidatus Marinimicrobia bacterium]|nr:polysaccharide biosynthesis tyrosine autokinase [Candidatus Neomarinimicrobiota bacterium]
MNNNGVQNSQNGYFPEEEQVSLQDYIRVLYRYRWLIILSFVVILTGTVWYTFTTQPIYEASTTIMIKSEKSNMEDLFGGPVYSGQKELNNQIEYLKSRTLSEQVIENLDNTKYADSLYVLGTAGEMKESFLSKAKKLPYVVYNWLIGKEVEESTAESYEERIRRLASRLRGWMTVEPVRETDVIKINIQAPAKREAVLIANTIANEYHKQNLQISRGEVSQVKQFLNDQLENVEDNLFQAEVALKDYQQEAEVAALDKSTESLIEQLSEVESNYNSVIAERQSLETRLDYLKSQLSDQEKKIVGDISDINTPYVKALRDSLASKQVKLTVMRTNPDIPPDHPGIRKVEARIAELEQEVRRETQRLINKGMEVADPLSYSQEMMKDILNLQAQIVTLRSKESFLGSVVKEYNSRLESLPQKSLRLARLKRDQQVNEKLFLLMKTKYEETRITEAGQIGNVQIMDPAVPPKSPVKPNKKLNLLLGMLLGAGLGVGLAFTLEYLDNTVKTAEDLERMNLRVLGMVPVIDNDELMEKAEELLKENGESKFSREGQRIEQRLVTHLDPKSPVSEAYRTLRTNLQYITPDEPLKSILVTSAGPGEGKSTTAANLAITMAQMGNKSILIDADLRRPVAHKIFHQPRTPGLTDVLMQEMSSAEVVKETGIENLEIITSGNLPPNPSELLGSKYMQNLLEELSNKYDRIILDSPPVIAVTDAAVLSTEVTDTMIVVSSGNTDRKALERAKKQISDVGGEIAGSLLNNVRRDNVYGSYYYYYQYYYYSGDGDKKRKRRHRKA